MDTGQHPQIMDKSIKKVYIKDGKRKMPTGDGYMMMSAKKGKQMFGAHRGGKYSAKQKLTPSQSGRILPRDPKTGFPKGYKQSLWE